MKQPGAQAGCAVLLVSRAQATFERKYRIFSAWSTLSRSITLSVRSHSACAHSAARPSTRPESNSGPRVA
eukprot:1961279-Pleurochrysis_carterae.AAC.2